MKRSEFKEIFKNVPLVSNPFREAGCFHLLGVFFCDSLDLCYDPCHVIKHES